MHLGAVLRQSAKDLPPGYFALVMATGIVSIDASELGTYSIALILLAVGLVAYAVLWLLTLIRLFVYPSRMLEDLTVHLRGPAFLTAVAGTSIVGSQIVVLFHLAVPGLLLWMLAVLLLLILTYAFLGFAMVREHKPSLEDAVDGGWLVLVVATQSVAVLGALLAPDLASGGDALLFVAVSAWLVGCTLYLLRIGLIFHRLVFLAVTPQAVTPPYWINMGATAITALAGSLLALAAPRMALLTAVLPFVDGLTVLFWAVGTWWMPLLVILGIWRHLYRRFPIAYDPLYWNIVFPLGMYASATWEVGRATGLAFLAPIAQAFAYVALLAWAVVFVGLVRGLQTRLR